MFLILKYFNETQILQSIHRATKVLKLNRIKVYSFKEGSSITAASNGKLVVGFSQNKLVVSQIICQDDECLFLEL